MSADTAIYAHLTADPLVSGLVQSIFIGRAPNDAPFPILQLQQVGGLAIPSLLRGWKNGARNAIYQIDVYSLTRENAHEIWAAVMNAMADNPPATFKAIAQDEPSSIYEEDTNDNRLTSRVSVWY